MTVFFSTLVWTCSLVVKMSLCDSGDMGSNLAWGSPLVCHCTDMLTFALLLQSCTLYNFFSLVLSVAISLWKCFNSQYEHQTSTALEHLESGPVPRLCHMLAWHMGMIKCSDCNYCIASEQKSLKGHGHCFYLNSWKYLTFCLKLLFST